MACFVPDFHYLFESEKYSDVNLEIVEDAADVGEKRNRGLTMPGHSTVLMAFSGYCKVKVSSIG